MRTLVTTAVVGSLLVIAACGDDSAPGTADGLAAPRPISVAGSGSGSAASGGKMAAESSADMSIMPVFSNIEYVLADGFPALPTASTGYEYPAGVELSEDAVRTIADALGVAGDPVRGGGATVDGVAWRVGPDDGSAPTVTVSADAQGTWYYSGAWDREAAVGCAQAIDESGNPVGEPCPAPEPPAGVPDEARTEQLATELFASLGLDVTTAEIDVYADEWSASASASPVLGDVRAPISWGVGYGGDEVLQWANGVLLDPIATGPFELVDVDTALARLDEQGGWWGGYGRGAVGEPMPLDAGVPEPAPIDPAVDPAVSGPAVEPGAPLDEPVEPETITVTLVGVEADLWWVSEPDGSVWLLPAYRFLDADGGMYTVPAVSDTYLETAPVPDTVTPVTEVPLPDPAVPPTSELPPATTAPAPVDPPAPSTTLLPDGLDEIFGAPVAEATALATERGYELRVVRLDGEDLLVTEDFVENRLNVAVEGDVVVAFVSAGRRRRPGLMPDR
jgi:hypothetical protein